MQRSYPRDDIRANLHRLGFPSVQHHESVLRRLLSDFELEIPGELGPDELAERIIDLASRGTLSVGPDFTLRRGPARRATQLKR